MFGCHKCEHAAKSFNSYDESPCASCVTCKNPAPISHFASDPASFESLTVMHPAYDEEGEAEDRIERALSALGQCVRRLVAMKDKHPDTYKFIIAKMDKPALSYSEIALMFDCKKQNVLYHFRKAVKLFPELSHALIVDRRFLAGRSSALAEAKALARRRMEQPSQTERS